MEELINQFKYLVGGYYGMCLLDEYPQKEFILQDIKNYIKDFLEINEIEDFDYRKEAEKLEDGLTDKRKLQDLLIVLNKINSPMEVVFLTKRKLRELEEKDNF